jgi:hypothetical protein
MTGANNAECLGSDKSGQHVTTHAKKRHRPPSPNGGNGGMDLEPHRQQTVNTEVAWPDPARRRRRMPILLAFFILKGFPL